MTIGDRAEASGRFNESLITILSHLSTLKGKEMVRTNTNSRRDNHVLRMSSNGYLLAVRALRSIAPAIAQQRPPFLSALQPMMT
jgi:hypothetical protein